MKQTIFYLTLILLQCTQLVHAQYSYDKQKIAAIRWSPIPVSVTNVKEIRTDLNGNWNFSEDPAKNFFMKNSLSDSKSIEVPGEWVMQGFTVKPGTWAAYQRNFNIPADWKNMRVILKFEAVYSECNVWINKKHAGYHMGGMTSFEMDITPLIKNGDNTIALAVRSESLADTLSSASKYAVHPLGGITRPVYLIALPGINAASFHVSTHFDTQYKDAVLKTTIKIANEYSSEQKAEVKLTLRDSQGKEVRMKGDTKGALELAANSIQTKTFEANIKEPLKWDPEHPNLYTLECELKSQGKTLCRVTRRVGFRQIEVRGNQVFVNNMPIKLKGVCRHEVSPLRGRSLIGNQWYEDVKLFKEGNFNYIRTSHYPPNEKLLEACDELGMFVEEEAPFCWANKKPVNNGNYFEAILQPTLEMVERDKSHPSILMWSIANESNDFNELFKTSSDLVKEADPTRPRNFSQWSPNGDGEYLEIGNHHYPGPNGPDTYKDSKRPITFDEFCHLNAYNRFELMTDPGMRDYWGEILLRMWEKMYRSKGVLGGALWAGIDDSFFLPSGKVVGYGTWGPVDGWRRPKPEYWHAKKIFSPVKIALLQTADTSKVALNIENRFFFSNLNECIIKWDNGTLNGEIRPDIKPGSQKVINLPLKYQALEKLRIQVFKDSKVPVDEYVFDHSKPDLLSTTPENDTFTWSTNGDTHSAASKHIKVTISKNNFSVKTTDNTTIVSDLPALMLVTLNNHGDTQMTPSTPDYTLFSPTAANRKIESFELQKGETEFTLTIRESYNEAIGKICIRVNANGHLNITYNYMMRTPVNCRQWGLGFSLNPKTDQLDWKRKGLWTVYPSDHIGRIEGTAKLFYGHPECGLAGPATKPNWPYNEDQTRYGSNDFRSTKRNILDAALYNAQLQGLSILSDGSQHIRCWFDTSATKLLVAEYDNPGSERFLASHARSYDKVLKEGDKISGVINMQISNKIK